MSCKKWEESIYLYDELTENERTQLDSHLKECSDCAMLFHNVRQLQGMVKVVGDNKASVRDATLLTNKIMRALPSEHVSSARVNNVFASLMDSLFTRYALGAISILLILFFVNEQQSKINYPQQEIVHFESKASVPLNTKAFMMVVIKEKPVENSLYACVKSNECEYEIVKMYKQKKNHENL